MSAAAGAANLHTRIDARLMEVVRREAEQRNVSIRTVVESAVRERYDPVAAQRQDAALLAEVRALRREEGQVNFANRVMVELTTVRAPPGLTVTGPTTRAAEISTLSPALTVTGPRRSPVMVRV